MHSRLRNAVVLALMFSPILLAGRSKGPEPARPIGSQPADERVDINHATVEQLLKVPGMTRTWAQRIVRFRPYRTKQDLLDEGVLPGEVYNRVKEYLIAHREKK